MSTRIEEAVIQHINALAKKLGTSKKAVPDNQGVRNKTIIARVMLRSVKKPIDHQRSGFLVDFVLDRIRSDGDLDNDIDIFGRIFSYTYFADIHGCMPPESG